MTNPVTVFVSYSHQDASYLENNSLLGYLKGLEADGVKFWTDRQLRAGELWDEVIKTRIREADIALVLVSQGFLDSPYCRDVEIASFLAQKKYLFPVILSPCEWQRHEWLRRRQFLPGGDETIEEHYTDPGRRKRLFLEIRQQLRERVEAFRQAAETPVSQGTPAPAAYPGPVKVEFCKRLGDDWRKLADHLGVESSDQARFERGDEGRGLWTWLDNRRRLAELPAVSVAIGRQDLADLLRSGG